MLAGCGCWPPRWHCDCGERDKIQFEDTTPPMSDNVLAPTPEVPGKIEPWQRPEISIATPKK
jgi:hypothetical protein